MNANQLIETNESENENIIVTLNYSGVSSVKTGRPNGKSCYISQMKDLIEPIINRTDVNVIIVFPNHIKLVSGSYLLGMFDEIYKRIGIEGIKQRFTFNHNLDVDPMKLLINEIIHSGC